MLPWRLMKVKKWIANIALRPAHHLIPVPLLLASCLLYVKVGSWKRVPGEGELEDYHRFLALLLLERGYRWSKESATPAASKRRSGEDEALSAISRFGYAIHF